jgi:hypothetical protein
MRAVVLVVQGITLYRGAASHNQGSVQSAIGAQSLPRATNPPDRLFHSVKLRPPGKDASRPQPVTNSAKPRQTPFRDAIAAIRRDLAPANS